MRLIEHLMSMALSVCQYAVLAYWQPRSLWCKNRLSSGPRFSIVAYKASLTNSVANERPNVSSAEQIEDHSK